jgi:hypothetical protein
MRKPTKPRKPSEAKPSKRRTAYFYMYRAYFPEDDIEKEIITQKSMNELYDDYKEEDEVEIYHVWRIKYSDIENVKNQISQELSQEISDFSISTADAMSDETTEFQVWYEISDEELNKELKDWKNKQDEYAKKLTSYKQKMKEYKIYNTKKKIEKLQKSLGVDK